MKCQNNFRLMSICLTILFLEFLLLVNVASAAEIPSGYVSSYTLNSAGTTYTLTGDIKSNTSAFVVAANNIVFNGNGYKIDFGLNGSGMGINNDGKTNITIKDVNIVQHDPSSSSHAILMKNTANTRIINCTVSTVAGNGIYITGNKVIVDNCSVNSVSGRAIYLNANNSMVTNSMAISGSYYGLGLSNSWNNTIINSTASSDSSYGIGLMASNNNVFLNCAGYSNISHGFYLLTSNNNTLIDSIGYTNSTSIGDGVYMSDSSHNTFSNVTASSSKKTGFYLNNMTTYNNFINCTGESYNDSSIYNGIWFDFPTASCTGTNTYINFM